MPSYSDIAKNIRGSKVRNPNQQSEGVEARVPAQEAAARAPAQDPILAQGQRNAAQAFSSSKDLSNSEKLTLGLIGTIPILLGSIFQGKEGGAAGAKAGAEGALSIGKGISERNKYDSSQAEKKAEFGLKLRGADQKDKALEIKDKQTGKSGVKPTKLGPSQVKTLSGFQTGYKMLGTLQKIADANPNSFGLLNKVKNSIDPRKINDETNNALDLDLEKIGVTVGTAIVGRPLYTDEVKEWKHKFSRKDSPEGIKQKIQVAERLLRDQESSYVSTANANNQPTPGYQVAPEKELAIEHPPQSAEDKALIENIAKENNIDPTLAEQILMNRRKKAGQ